MKRSDSRRIYVQRINRVMDYISEHLDEPLPLERLARLAHFSPFHFHRLFGAIVGEPLHVFVRRLRLESAVKAMKFDPRATLTDVALRHGFASSSDFSKTFKQAYGFPPSQFTPEKFVENSKIRQELLTNAGYGFGKRPDPRNPDRFRVRIVERPAERIAFVRVIGTNSAERMMAGFQNLMDWGGRHGLVPSGELVGMSQDDPDVTPLSKYRYDFCLVLPPGFADDGQVSTRTMPAQRFAALRLTGDIHKLSRAWHYLFRAWLPSSGFEPTNEPTMEVYRGHPLEIGWEVFDIDCLVPVKPLGRRGPIRTHSDRN
jgi:AraC family transcriptional regulator